MRLATVESDGQERLALVEGEAFRLICPTFADSMLSAIRNGRLNQAEAHAEAEPASHVRVLAPYRPSTIICIGLNFRDHIRETGMDTPTAPLLFSKMPGSVIGTGDDIVVDRSLTERADWEVELGVVIGQTTANVSVDSALAHVAGYTTANDISARDLQFGDGQWFRGKSLDTFCPLGPCLVTADEIRDPQALSMRTWVNDELVQDASTSEMIFGVAEIVSFCSRYFTLSAGDLILTGTPWGVGEFMEPKRSLQDGDVVSVEIESIGTVTNPVRERAG